MHYGFELGKYTGNTAGIVQNNRLSWADFVVVESWMNPDTLEHLNVPWKMDIPCILKLRVGFAQYVEGGSGAIEKLTKDTDLSWKQWKNLFFYGTTLRGINGVILDMGETPDVADEAWLVKVMEWVKDVVYSHTSLPIFYQIPSKALTMYPNPSGIMATWLTQNVKEAAIYSEAWSGSTPVNITGLTEPDAGIKPPQPWITDQPVFWNYSRVKTMSADLLTTGSVILPLWRCSLPNELYWSYLNYQHHNASGGVTAPVDETTEPNTPETIEPSLDLAGVMTKLDSINNGLSRIEQLLKEVYNR